MTRAAKPDTQDHGLHRMNPSYDAASTALDKRTREMRAPRQFGPFALSGLAASAARTQDEIEADFDNMPV